MKRFGDGGKRERRTGWVVELGFYRTENYRKNSIEPEDCVKTNGSECWTFSTTKRDVIGAIKVAGIEILREKKTRERINRDGNNGGLRG